MVHGACQSSDAMGDGEMMRISDQKCSYDILRHSFSHASKLMSHKWDSSLRDGSSDSDMCLKVLYLLRAITLRHVSLTALIRNKYPLSTYVR